MNDSTLGATKANPTIEIARADRIVICAKLVHFSGIFSSNRGHMISIGMYKVNPRETRIPMAESNRVVSAQLENSLVNFNL